MISEISCLACNDLKGLSLPTVLCYVLYCWRIRLTHASAKTKDLAGLALCLSSVKSEPRPFRGGSGNFVSDYIAVGVHCRPVVRVPHTLLLNGFRGAPGVKTCA